MRLGTLYLVSTPIGNLEDITLRALRILREVPKIACEDTRWTRKLLSHHGISTDTLSFHRFNEKRRIPCLIRDLVAGDDLALVTDGGTPSVSDPGFSLVRAALREGIPVVPIPGASAPLSALVASGLPAGAFTVFGFLPHRSSERCRFLEKLRERTETLIFFDSPRRISESLREMARIFGDRMAVVCREMTKMHEEFLRGTLSELEERLQPGRVRGEITLVVTGAPAPGDRPVSGEDLREEVEREIREGGKSRRDAIRTVARARGVSRRELYRSIAMGDRRRERVTFTSDESE